MQLLGNIDFLSFIKSNNRELETKQKTRPEWNYGIPALPPTGGRPVPVVHITFQSNNPQHLQSPEIEDKTNNSANILPTKTHPAGSSFFTAFPAISSNHEESSGSAVDNSTTSIPTITMTDDSLNLTFPVIPSDQEESRSQADNSSNSSNSIPSHDFSFFPSFPTIPADPGLSLSNFFPLISLKPESSSNVFQDFGENLNFLFGKPAASPAPAGRPEKETLTNVSAKANLREGPKFFFGPTKSEEEDFDETAGITEEETRTEGQSNFSQVLSQIWDPLQQEKRENKTPQLKSTTEGEKDKISEELDIALLLEDYHSNTENHYDYDLSSLFDEYLVDI